jgi:hypothetical protein
MDDSHRIFHCVRCSTQVILCRSCDRGNIYCSAICADEQRRKSLQRASKRYQGSDIGKSKHALRQAKYRERLAEANQKVTHQGSNFAAVSSPVVTGNDALNGGHCGNGSPIFLCSECGACVGIFGRFNFWRGGRGFARLVRRSSKDYQQSITKFGKRQVIARG